MKLTATCCDKFNKYELEEIIDLGRSEAIDYILFSCNNCKSYIMHLWSEYSPESTFVKVEPSNAQLFISLRKNETNNKAIKEAINNWIDSL